MTKYQKPKGKGVYTLPVIAAVILLAALVVMIFPQQIDGKKEVSKTESLTIPKSSVTEIASFYPVKVDGTDLEVLAIRTANGEIRTAFNTCQTCYSSGRGYYTADRKELVCQNCGFRFTAERVGHETSGGCNPWPIMSADRVETEEAVTIPYHVLADAKEVFINWRE